MRDEITEHLEDFWRQPGMLARSVQGIELRIQGTIGKAVEHTSSVERRQLQVLLSLRAIREDTSSA